MAYATANHTDRLIQLAKSNQEFLAFIQRTYEKFPLEVRFGFGKEWFEKNIVGLQPDMNPADSISGLGAIMYGELVNTLRVAEQSCSDFVQKLNIRKCITVITENYSNDHLKFVRELSLCYKREFDAMAEYERKRKGNVVPEPADDAQDDFQVRPELCFLENICNKVDFDVENFSKHQEAFLIEYQELCEEINKHPGPSSERNQLEFRRDDRVKDNYTMRKSLMVAHTEVVNRLEKVIQIIWSKIDQWWNDSKLEITGLTKPSQKILDRLEMWCSTVNNIFTQVTNQSSKIEFVFNQLRYAQTNDTDIEIREIDVQKNKLTQLLRQHLNKIFIIVRNPPQVIKVIVGKSNGFAMSCRILGGDSLGLKHCNPSVTAELHNQETIATAQVNNEYTKGICDILNGKAKPFDYYQQNKAWICNFNSVQLQKVKQIDRGPAKWVTENLHTMVFYTTVKVCEQEFKLKACSLAIGLISHVLQDCNARAFLIWDAAFSKEDHKRKLFEHPDAVQWKEVSHVLNSLFKYHTGTGLTDEHLKYLGKIAFREKQNGNFDDRTISRSQLMRDRLHKDFSFWKWFYANLNLIKDKLRNEWNDGIIYGFIGKDDIQKRLEDKAPGTFLLRFSERDIENSSRADVCGCLTLAVVEYDPTSECNKVFHVKEHLTPRDIVERGLATILEAFEVKDPITKYNRQLLKTLYPNRSFGDAFGKYIVETQKARGASGYAQGRLRIQICLFDDPDLLPRRQGPIQLPDASPLSVSTLSPASDFNPESPGSFLEQLAEANHPVNVATVQPMRFPESPYDISDGVLDLAINAVYGNNAEMDSFPILGSGDSMYNSGSGFNNSGTSVEFGLNSGGQARR